MPNYFVGIDPGKRGAFAVITEKGEFVRYWRMEEDLVQNKKNLEPYAANTALVVIEKAMVIAKNGERQGAVSMFNYGVGYGKLLGMLSVLKLEYHEVMPQQWQKLILGKFPKGKSKEASRKIATALHPDVNFIPHRCRKVHDGVTDAICMAHYGRRYLQQ